MLDYVQGQSLDELVSQLADNLPRKPSASGILDQQADHAYFNENERLVSANEEINSSHGQEYATTLLFEIESLDAKPFECPEQVETLALKHV